MCSNAIVYGLSMSGIMVQIYAHHCIEGPSSAQLRHVENFTTFQFVQQSRSCLVDALLIPCVYSPNVIVGAYSSSAFVMFFNFVYSNCCRRCNVIMTRIFLHLNPGMDAFEKWQIVHMDFARTNADDRA